LVVVWRVVELQQIRTHSPVPVCQGHSLEIIGAIEVRAVGSCSYINKHPWP